MRLTFDDHKQLAKDIRDARTALNKVASACNCTHSKNSLVVAALRRSVESLNTAVGHLDDEYHTIVTDEQFEDMGHIYY